MSAAKQHNSESPDTQGLAFPYDAGQINLLKGTKSRLYYCYAAQGGFMYLRQIGNADHEEIMNFTTRLIKDESWPNGAKLFMDLRWYNSSVFGFDAYFKLTLEIAALYGKHARYYAEKASLCGNDSEYGMHRMFLSILEDGKRVLGAFRDIEKAVDFLKIDRPLLERVIAEIDRIDASEFSPDHA